MAHRCFMRVTFIALALVIVSPMFEASAQRRRQAKSEATLTVKASIYYEVGGFQPVPPTTFVILDEDPEALLSFLGDAPVATYAVAKITGESLEIAKLRIQLGQQRSGFMREQVENLLDATRQSERLKAEAAFGRNGRYAPDREAMLKASARLSNQTLASAVTNDEGVAVFRGLRPGQPVFLLGMSPTRGGVVVWSFAATLKPGSNEKLVLNQANALLAF